MPLARNLGRALLAIVLGLIAVGLPYLYVGRARFAIVQLSLVLALIASFAWTRLILHPWAGGALVVLGAIVVCLPLLHVALLAYRRTPGERRSYNRLWIYVAWIIGFAGLQIALQQTRAHLFGVEPFHTPTESMAPTLQLGDAFVVDTWRYKAHSPERGEIVVYQVPEKPGVKYVKRVIGVAGDRIEIRTAVVYRNGEALSEPYLHAPVDSKPYGRDEPAILIPQSSVYLLGDNRDMSLDSRAHGPIARPQLHGRVEYVIYPLRDGRYRISD
jgi:signal peptidase I